MATKLKNYFFTGIASLSIAVITSCGSSKTDTKTTDSTVKVNVATNIIPPQATDSVVTIADPTASKLMMALYSDYDAKTKSATWQCNKPEKLKKFELTSGKKFLSKLLFADSLTAKGTKYLYLITSSRPNGDDFVCHACAPIVEVFIFEKQAPDWRLTYRKIFDQVGAYGEAPEFKLKQLGPDSFGFLIAPGDMHQGETEQYVAIYAYYQSEFKSILEVADVGMDNTGGCDDKVPGSCWSYDYTLSIANTPHNYNDITITKKGTENKVGKTIPVDTAYKYQFAGSGYIKQ